MSVGDTRNGVTSIMEKKGREVQYRSNNKVFRIIVKFSALT